MGRRVLLVWNPVSTGVTADSLGSVLVRMAARLEVVAMHTLGAGDAERLGGLAVERDMTRCSCSAATERRTRS